MFLLGEKNKGTCGEHKFRYNALIVFFFFSQERGLKDEDFQTDDYTKNLYHTTRISPTSKVAHLA